MRLRDVAKQAVRLEITAAAVARFRSQGFEETTVEQIASDIGMSSRTFFRYFQSKDEVVLQSSRAWRIRFLDSLKAALPANDLWLTLARTLASITIWCQGNGNLRHGKEMQALICSTPILLARHLELMEGAQAEAAEVCLAAADEAIALGPSTVHAIIGSAFACYNSLRQLCDMGDDAAFDQSQFEALMEVMRPCILLR